MSSFTRAAALAAIGVALAAPASASEALARKYACTACHQVDKKVCVRQSHLEAREFGGKDGVHQGLRWTPCQKPNPRHADAMTLI